MIDHDVAKRADRVVEMATILDPETLRHGDLHALEVVPAPDRLEHRVGESQLEDLEQAHLPQVVIDAEELGLVDVLMEFRGQLARRLQVVSERLLHDDPSARRHPGSESPFTTVPNRKGGISR